MTNEDAIKILEEMPISSNVHFEEIAEAIGIAIKALRNERPRGEWKVIGRNVPNNIWHVFCPKCNCDMFTEFTSYCPNCGEPKKEINIAELNMRGD